MPKEILHIIKELKENGFEGYAVGGCVRDLLRGVNPEDYDVATDATPEEVQKIFKKSFSNNEFGTVTVFTGSEKKNLKEVEVTTYRTEEEYKDKRHPERVNFVDSIEEDLKRRDFTINAIALKPSPKQELEGSLIDPFEGRKDLQENIIRAVGDPQERFSEDALRMIRAIRFSSTFGFSIEKNTRRAVKKNAGLLKKISSERIRDEFQKIIMTERAMEGVEELRELGVLKEFLPELLEGYKVDQSKHHIYDCYTHCIYSLDYAAKQGFNFHVRMAALLHDIGKPRTKRGEGEDATFHNHEVVGMKMTRGILKRLKFKRRDIDKISLLVRYHLFYYNVGEVTESSIRRLLRKVGRENIDELLQVRMADRIGSGVPKAEPYRLRHMRYLIERVSRDPITTSMLDINGEEVMKEMNISPGPIVGHVLNILLLEVMNDPQRNKEEILRERVKEMREWGEGKIEEKGKRAKEEIDKIEEKRDEMTKKKYWVS